MGRQTPAKVTRLAAGGEPLDAAVAAFLTERDLAPSSHRVYVFTLARLTDHLGPETPVEQVSPRLLAEFMAARYPHLAAASWNRVLATLGSFFAYTTGQGWTPTSPAVGLERHRHRLDRDAHARSRAIPAADLLAFLRAKHPVRDKTLWWLLYESAARAGEVLALDIDDLDLPRRRAVVIGKGGRAELIGWETRTARLLPRHLAGREQGPLFLTDLAVASARQPAAARPRQRACPAVLPAGSPAVPGRDRRVDPAPAPPLPVDPPGRSRGPATHPHGQEPPPRHSTPTAGTNPKPQSGDITRRLARLPRFAPLSYDVVDATGSVVGSHPGRGPMSWQVVLAAVPDGWRILSVDVI